MYTKLITLLLVCSIGASVTFSNGSNDRHRAIKIVPNGDVFRGDTGPIVNRGGVPIVNDRILTPPMSFGSDAITWTISEVSVDGRTQYDLQSNGNTNYIVQNPTNPLNMHACFMVATDPNPWNTRNVRYFYTTDGGTSWSYLGTVTTARSGFPCITMTSDDRAVIMNHSTDGGGILRGQIYVDVAPGAGSWTRLNPGTTGGTITPIWPDATIDRQTPNKLLFCVSQQTPGDSLFRNVCTNLNSPGTFLGYQHVPLGETAEQYATAVTLDGSRYGIAYCTSTGGAEYRTSTDDGVTWSAPTVVWTWNPADSTGTLRTVDLIYDAAGTPKVLVGLGSVDPVGGSFIPGLPSKVIFWSPGINGGNPVTIDSAAGLNGSNPANDVFFSVTRSTIGMSYDNNAIYVAYNKVRTDTSAEGNNYFDTWFRYSSTGGATWSPKTQLTNVTGPLRDCRYPAISPTNHFTVNGPHYAHIVVMSDSVPGSNVNGAPASESKMTYIKVTITDPIGIHNIGGEVPGSYQLYQNYPNPFNPSTKIKFALPKSGFVTLKLYDVLGKELGTLISEDISAGTFEYVLNANNLPSGVYFYSLRAGDFSDSKKMILVK
ncbi:MAG TPA: T9SS type A sorting domain-containing protein [Ignavibacteria bacterium]|jgi:hypothetical protein